MSFSQAQQLTYRRVVSDAWKAVAKRTSAPVGNATMKDAWTRSVLHRVTGVWSTTEVDSRKHFAAVLAEFEQEAGDSIYWQLRAAGGSRAEVARRLLHKIKGVCAKHHIDEGYARGVMRQALSLGDADPTPDVGKLESEQMMKVLDGLKAAARRMEVAS